MHTITCCCGGLFFTSNQSDLSVDLFQVCLVARQNSWNPLQSDGFMDSRNDVCGFHAWESERLWSLQICLSGVWPRTSGAPAALLRILSHIPRSRLACCWAFPAWKSFSWQRVLRPLFGLRLPRRSERSSFVRLHVLPAQQSRQQPQSGPQQIRTDRYVRKSGRAKRDYWRF